MALKFKNYSTTAANNNSSPPNGWPEGQLPSTVNNCARENMARERELYEEMDWQDLGHSVVTASAGSITLSGDVSAFYPVRRMVRITDGVTTQVGFVASVSFSTNTVVTITGTSTTAVTPTGIEVSVLRQPAHFLQSTKSSSAYAGFQDATNTNNFTFIGCPSDWAKASDVASASTTSIGAIAGNYVVVTGTTTITSFGTAPQAGAVRVVRFSGALTLTHNGTSLILPGAANITTVAGDVGVFISEGSSNWRCIGYSRPVGAISMTSSDNWLKAADLASASTTDIGGIAGNYVVVTGTTTITALGTAPQAGAVRLVRFSGALTLTYNATSLVLPGAANITTAAGDMALFVADTTTNWRCLNYQRATPLVMIGRTVFTSDGTWNRPSGCTAIFVEAVGRGGAAGDCTDPNINQVAVSGGGGGGAYACKFISSPSSSYSVELLGSGFGGATQFGSTVVVANGGSAGDNGTAGTTCSAAGGAGGSGGTGDFTIPGEAGGTSAAVETTNSIAILGSGGKSHFSNGIPAKPVIVTGSAQTDSGIAGKNYGGGASGAFTAEAAGTAITGAAGAGGICIVWEFGFI